MIKQISLFIGVLTLFSASSASALTPKNSVKYQAGTKIDLPKSGGAFQIPAGWHGSYRPDTQNFEMFTPTGQPVAVRYNEKSYKAEIADAKRGFKMSNGESLQPTGQNEKVNNGRFHGEAIAYSGMLQKKYQLSAISLVLRNPIGNGLVIKSAAMGNNFPAVTSEIMKVMNTMNFTGKEKKSRKSSSKGSQKGPVKYAKGNPFKKGHGMGPLPAYRDHSRNDLYLFEAGAEYKGAKSSGHSTLLSGFRFMNGQSRVIFCSEDDINKYRGTYIVDEFSEDGWRSTGGGRYQVYSTKPSNSWPGSRVKQPEDIMFIDRVDGSSVALKVKTLKFNGGYWGDEMSFNGAKFIQKGISKKCPAKSFGDMDMKQTLLDASAAEIRSSRPSSSSRSSSGSYDTHFGTTSSGNIIFSSPSGSMCSGC